MCVRVLARCVRVRVNVSAYLCVCVSVCVLRANYQLGLGKREER